jgi:hypothetical protein
VVFGWVVSCELGGGGLWGRGVIGELGGVVGVCGGWMGGFVGWRGAG